MKPWRRRGLALLSGLLLWLSFPNAFALNFEAWTAWLAWGALIPLCVALRGQSEAQGFRSAWLSGFVFYLLSLTWITHVKPMGPAVWPALLGLSLWCALFTGFWGLAVAWVGRRRAPLPLLALAAFWALLELLRERLFTGFPWVSLGSSQAFNPAVLPLASVGGLLALHFAVALGNLLLFAALFEQRLLTGLARGLSASVAMGLLLLGAQWGRTQAAVPDAPRVKVGVIQGGLDQDRAWTKAYREQLMNTYLTLSQAALDEGAKALLWPESSFPGFFNEDAAEAKQLKAFARKNKIDLLIGSTLELAPGRYSNSALWIDARGNTRSQGKRHMVPFGEYVPFRKAVPLLDAAMARMGVTDFLPGTAEPLFSLGGLKTQPIVCYESVFPAVARQGEAPDLLGVITVDTWYGHSAGPVWHAAQCALRAVENGCWVARSAATGISLFADDQGRLLQPIALDRAGYAVAEIPHGHASFYRRHGEWLAWVILLLLAILWIPSFRKKS